MRSAENIYRRRSWVYDTVGHAPLAIDRLLDVRTTKWQKQLPTTVQCRSHSRRLTSECLFVTACSMDQYAEEKRTEKNLIVRSGISEAETTNNKRLRYTDTKHRAASLRQQSFLLLNFSTADFHQICPLHMNPCPLEMCHKGFSKSFCSVVIWLQKNSKLNDIKHIRLPYSAQLTAQKTQCSEIFFTPRCNPIIQATTSFQPSSGQFLSRNSTLTRDSEQFCLSVCPSHSGNRNVVVVSSPQSSPIIHSYWRQIGNRTQAFEWHQF